MGTTAYTAFVKKLKVRAIQTIQRSLEKEWHAFGEKLPEVYFAASIADQEGTVYPIQCNSRNRKTTARKNLKAFSAHLKNYESLLMEFCESYKRIEDIDAAFDMLCYLSHAIDLFENRKKFMESHFGYKYDSNPEIEKIKLLCSDYYSNLLNEKIRKELKKNEQLIQKNEGLVQELDTLTHKIEEAQSAIAQAKLAVEENERHNEAAQAAYTSQKSSLKANISNLAAELETVAANIFETEESIPSKETDLASVRKEKKELLAKQQKLQSENAAFVKEHEQKTLAIQEQISEAEAIVQKTLLFKKSKIQRVEELKAAFNSLQEKENQRKKLFAKDMADLCSTCNALDNWIAQTTSVISSKREKLSQLQNQKTDLLHQLVVAKEALDKLENASDVAADALKNSNKELQEKNKSLETLETEWERVAKSLKRNKQETASFDKSITKKILIYPQNFNQTVDYTATEGAEYAFSKHISSLLNERSKNYAQILMLERKHLHLDALLRAIEQLQNEDLISSTEYFSSVSEEMNAVVDTLQTLKDETVACNKTLHSAANDDSITNNKADIVKKAQKLFDVFWSHVSDGISIPEELRIVLDGAKCVQVSANCYLCFTPFYVFAIEVRKNKAAQIKLLQYLDISLEIDAQQVSLDFGVPCPAGATVVAEHWKYETVSGTPNRRYTNNPTYYIVAVSALKLQYANKSKDRYLMSVEEAEKAIEALNALRSFLYEENADVMNRVFAAEFVPDVAEIVSEISTVRQMEERERKEQERRAKQNELLLKKQREEEKKQKEQHQKSLELWADAAERNKAKDEQLISQHLDLLPPITAAQIAGWDDQQNQPVSVTDRRRVITNGIIKVEFVQQEDSTGVSQYLVFFADQNGKAYSDIRSLTSNSIGTKSVIPFEIKTQSTSNPSKLYLLIRGMEDGQLVGKVEYKLNIAFTNDFDF